MIVSFDKSAVETVPDGVISVSYVVNKPYQIIM